MNKAIATMKQGKGSSVVIMKWSKYFGKCLSICQFTKLDHDTTDTIEKKYREH